MIFRAIAASVLLCVSITVQASNYTISAGDTIKISVYGEDDLTFDNLVIDGREMFEFPYLGGIKTKNKTLKQIQNDIRTGLKGDYLIDPKVNVSIVKYRDIFVNGVVNKPGAYEYQPDLTVEKAIVLAGGFLAKYRKTKGIYLTKSDDIKGLSDSEIKKLLKDRDEVSTTTFISPGDTIYVVSSFW